MSQRRRVPSPDQTPQYKHIKPEQQHPTPTKAKIQGAVEYMDAKCIPYMKQHVYDRFGASKEQRSAMLRPNEPPRRVHDDPYREEL